jgi:hypothetical protein
MGSKYKADRCKAVHDKINGWAELGHDTREFAKDLTDSYWQHMSAFGRTLNEAKQLFALQGLEVTDEMQQMARAAYVEREESKPMPPSILGKVREFADQLVLRDIDERDASFTGLKAEHNSNFRFWFELASEETKRVVREALARARSKTKTANR